MTEPIKITTVELVLYLFDELLKRWGNEEGEEDWEQLRRLETTLQELIEMAMHRGDKTLYGFLDDMQYVISETAMSARVKGEMAMVSLQK